MKNITVIFTLTILVQTATYGNPAYPADAYCVISMSALQGATLPKQGTNAHPYNSPYNQALSNIISKHSVLIKNANASDKEVKESLFEILKYMKANPYYEAENYALAFLQHQSEKVGSFPKVNGKMEMDNGTMGLLNYVIADYMNGGE